MKSGSNPKLDYVLVNLLSLSDQPSWQRALEYRRLHSAVGLQRDGKKKKTFSFDIQKYKDYGPGVYLYFNLLQLLFFTFIILSLNSIPVLISNYNGNGLEMYGDDSFGKSLMKLSLGNQRNEEYDTINNNPQIALDVKVSQIIVIVSDIISTIIFFYFLVYWKIKSDQIVQSMVSDHSLPSYYTLEVRNLPSAYSQESIKKHFQKFGGQVAQVSTVFDYENLLADIKILLKFVDEYAIADLNEKKYLYQLIELKYRQIVKSKKNVSPKPVMAIVTYQDMVLKKKVKDLYKYKVQPQNLKYRGKMPEVKTCRIQPSSILWQNFHLQTSTQVKHACCTFILLFIILFLALVALFLANAHATSIAQEQHNFTSQIDYQKDYTYRQAIKDGSIEVMFNFCSKLNYKDFQFRFYNFCQKYFDSYKNRFEGMIALSLLVVTINSILSLILYELANYRRYKTKTQKSRFLILNIFVLYFVNSGLLMLLVRLQIDGFSFGQLLSAILPLSLQNFNTQPYPDFNRKWYLNVGSQLIMIYALSLTLTPFLQIFISWAETKYRFFRARRQKTQQKMNQTLMGTQFDFQTFYALTLNCIFFTLFYANALPILYILAAISFLCLYIASAIVFKYFSCRPLLLDHSLNSVISKVMCLALVFHQLTSIFYFYTQDIFPMTGEVQEEGILIHKLDEGFYYIIISLILIIFSLNYGRCCRMIRQKIGKKNGKDKQVRKFHENFPQNGQQLYLSSYCLEDNEMYGNICYTMTILNMFSHFFVSKKVIEMTQNKQKSNESFDNRFGQLKQTHQQLSIFDNETSRPLKT